jgi:hypothetical protein
MRTRTLELVAEQSAEEKPPSSLDEGLGRLCLHFYRLERELSENEENQDAERLLEELVGLASAAVCLAEAHVLPNISGGSR